jgi:four helix bundle protein
MNPEELSNRLLEFAVRVAKVVDRLPDTLLGRQIAAQMIRSGTSPLANYEEGCGAESKKDFAHKLGICLKELRETRIWLRLIVKAGLIKEELLTDLIDEAEQLGRIIGKSIVTVKGVNSQEKN